MSVVPLLFRLEVLLLGVETAGVGGSITCRFGRRVALYIASSAASRITLSLNRPANITCSSLVNCCFLIFSGNVRNQEASVLDTDCFFVNFRSRREGFRRGSRIGVFNPRRSANDPFRGFCTGSSSSALTLLFCANLNRSNVEKYCGGNVSS
jgi:hypothetical protein